MMLVIHDQQPDPFVQTLLDCQDQWNEPMVALSLEKILQEATIFDVIEDGAPRLNWTLADIGSISNSPDIKLINRVTRVGPELFADFHEDDRDYAHTEFSAYMTFALNAFPRKLVAPGFFGLAGQQYPMPMQWDLIQKAGLGLAVPSYYLGATAYCPFDFNQSDIILNHTYGYRHWRPGGAPSGSTVFAIQRPQGTPYFAFVTDKACLIQEGPTASKASSELEARLKESAVAAAAALQCTVAEILFIVHEDSITFGVADVMPLATGAHPEFKNVVVEGIKGFFERHPHATHS